MTREEFHKNHPVFCTSVCGNSGHKTYDEQELIDLFQYIDTKVSNENKSIE